MKKNIAFLLATSLVATIAVGCDGTGYVEDVTEEDCPSGLVFRASDGQCVEPAEDVIDDSVSDTTEEVEDVTGDTTVTDPCEAWAYLEGTEWFCGTPGIGGDRIRATLLVSEDTHECGLVAFIIQPWGEEFFFGRTFEKIFFSPPPPEPPDSFTIAEPTFNGNCKLIKDE